MAETTRCPRTIDRTLANPKVTPSAKAILPMNRSPVALSANNAVATAVLEPKCSATSLQKIKVEHVTAATPVQYRPSSVASGARTRL